MSDVTVIPSATTRAVRTILEHPTFAEHADRFAAFSGVGMTGQPFWDFPAIIADWPWSGGEHIALRAAEALYRGTPFPGSDDLARLDHDLMVCVLQAQRIACGLDKGEVA